MCPVIKSNVKGTPDLKFIGIFSENRKEWYMMQLACCSDSICIIPVAVEDQFLNEDRIVKLLNETQMKTICVTSKTWELMIDLKSKNKIPNLQNLILFEPMDYKKKMEATESNLNVFLFDDLVEEGLRIYE